MLLLPSLRPSFVLQASHSPLSTGTFWLNFSRVCYKSISSSPSSFVILTYFGKQGPWFLAWLGSTAFIFLYIIVYFTAPLSVPIGKLQSIAVPIQTDTILCFRSHCLTSRLFPLLDWYYTISWNSSADPWDLSIVGPLERLYVFPCGPFLWNSIHRLRSLPSAKSGIVMVADD